MRMLNPDKVGAGTYGHPVGLSDHLLAWSFSTVIHFRSSVRPKLRHQNHFLLIGQHAGMDMKELGSVHILTTFTEHWCCAKLTLLLTLVQNASDEVINYLDMWLVRKRCIRCTSSENGQGSWGTTGESLPNFEQCEESQRSSLTLMVQVLPTSWHD